MTTPDGYSAVRESAGWIERQDVGRLRLRGTDRRSYLHGLLTNDIESLQPGEGVYAALLTAQGRMITDMHVYELGDAVLLTLPLPLTERVGDHLDRFIFSEDVQVEEVTGSTVQLGVYGPSASRAVQSLRTAHNFLLRSREFGVDGFEVISTQASAEDLVALLHAAQPVDPETIEVIRVESGIPRFLADMTETTIPLEAGIEDRAISMTKGCYPGQEVIVRVLHRGGGRVARKLVGIALGPEAELPAAGARVFSGDREIGVLTSAVSSRLLARPLALGYLHRDFTAPGIQVEVESAAGTRMPAAVQNLPVIAAPDRPM
jgi:folate-binding protein YgfZ